MRDALIDTRPREEKDKDYDHRELAFSAIPADYTTRAKATKIAKQYLLENQGATSSCAAHAGARCLAILACKLQYQRLSPAFIYRQRFNLPDLGMYVYDLGNIGRKFGACPYDMLPTPKTEKEINAVVITDEMRKAAEAFRGSDSITINTKNIEDYANVANNLELPVTVFVWGSVKEWSKEVPEVLEQTLTLENAAIRHLVAIVPKTAHVYKKKKYVTILDSSPFGKIYIRHVSEDYFTKRTVCGLYWLKKPEVQKGKLPKYTFTKDLWVGCIGEDVRMLQEALRSLGFFTYPESTGYFGGITRKAVEDFQSAYANKILKAVGLSKPTGYFGASTRKQLNAILNVEQ